jgi:branched-chain amino acid transport system substrate-binding protein
MVMIVSLLARLGVCVRKSASLRVISGHHEYVSRRQTTFGPIGTKRAATFGAIALLVAALTQVAGCNDSGRQGSTDKVIVIGADFATSGADATAGIPTQNGAVLAVEQEAARGLPGGYSIRIQTEDDAVGGVHDPSQGVRNVQALLQDDRVLAIVGPQNSSVARAEIPIAAQARIALISPSATSIGLTSGENANAINERSRLQTFFRTVVRDDLQGLADADFAMHALHAKRAYVIDDNEAYGKGIADVFSREFAHAGGVVSERTHLTKGQQDFMALLTRAQGFRPDLVYYGGVVSTGGALLRRQMVKLGMNATMMGGDGLWDPGFILAIGSDADGVYCSKGAPNLTVMPSARQFLKDYSLRFPSQDVGTYGANSYAAAQVAVEAIRRLMEKNGGVPPTREAVAREIGTSITPDTPIGPVSFTASGDMKSPVVSMWIVRRGKFVFVSQTGASAQ